MGREKRGGYIIEWWIGDHEPKHVHVFKDGREIAKVVIPSMRLLSGKMNKKIKKIIEELLKEEKI
ncbi:MAG: DUF4160 domain-containing protein [Halobacteriovoraceae bacterium]|nr:DUF4160 domain-containing protein [Halobacteriovoraceae bacterium]